MLIYLSRSVASIVKILDTEEYQSLSPLTELDTLSAVAWGDCQFIIEVDKQCAAAFANKARLEKILLDESSKSTESKARVSSILSTLSERYKSEEALHTLAHDAMRDSLTGDELLTETMCV